MFWFIFRIIKPVSQLSGSPSIGFTAKYFKHLVLYKQCRHFLQPFPEKLPIQLPAYHFHVTPCALKKGKSLKQSKMKVVVRPVDVEEVIDLNEINGQLQSFIENLQEDFLRDYRIGSDVAVFEKFPVVVDNEQVLLSDIAQITKEFPRLVVIDMVAYPELIKDVVNSLQASDLNVNPVADGSLIKVQVSQATTEYRKQVVSKADKRAKTCKSEMRQYIAKEIKAFRNLEVSDNMKKIVTEQLAIYLDYHLPQVDNIFKAKEAALLAP